MITLQADPLIQWDETKIKIENQSLECQLWVTENLLSQTPEENTETIEREGKADLIRITDQTYSTEGFELKVSRTYFNQNDSSVLSAQYVLTEI